MSKGITFESLSWLLGWLVAAATLLFTVYVHFDKKKDQKIKLRVTHENGVLTYHSGRISDPMLFIKIANIGNKTVTLNTPHINVKHSDGGSLFTEYGAYQQMPYVLQSGDSFVAWYEIKPIAKALKRHGLSGKINIVGSYTTQVGDEYKAKPYKLDVDDWSKD